MALDPMMTDAILGTFRTMAQEVKDKGLAGDDVVQMNLALERLEQLAAEHSDMNAFNGQVMQEGLYMKFSDHYGKALSASQSEQYQVSETEYTDASDQQLLKQSLDAYRGAIERLRTAKTEAVAHHGKQAADVFLNDEAIIKPIEDLIALGESGISFAQWLRKTIELGLDKATEGAAVTRDGIVYSRDFYAAAKINPFYEERENAYLQKWDELCASAKFNSPSILKYNLACEKINLPIDAKIRQWESEKDYYDKALSSLSWWAMAHMSFAFSIEPWSMARDPKASVEETLACNPGEFAVRLHLLKKYNNLSFEDIFKTESFKWDVTWHFYSESQEYIEFLKNEVFPHCKPGQRLPQELVSKMESLYKEKRMYNPESYKINERYKANHDQYFGAGSFEKKVGVFEQPECNAKPWDLGTFK